MNETIQVVFPPALVPTFEKWLEDYGFYLFRMPNRTDEVDDLPTYGIGIKNA